MTTLPERVARLEEQMRAISTDVAALQSDLHSRPDGVRARLHALEGIEAGERTTIAAEAALHARQDVARAERERKLAWAIGVLLTAGNIALSVLLR